MFDVGGRPLAVPCPAVAPRDGSDDIGARSAREPGGNEMRRLGEESGASAVEFAIVASVLFLVLFGTIQFGIVFNRYQGLQAGAREGARLAAVHATHDEIVQRVKDSVSIINEADIEDPCPGTLFVGDGCVDIDPDSATGDDAPCDGIEGDTITVLAKYRQEIPIPFWTSPDITITGRGEFRCE